MKSTRWFVSYVAVALVGLGLAFSLSLRFLTPAHSQNGKLEAPSAGDLPPEFMNEVNKTQVPPGSGTPAASATPDAKAGAASSAPNANGHANSNAAATTNSNANAATPNSNTNGGANKSAGATSAPAVNPPSGNANSAPVPPPTTGNMPNIPPSTNAGFDEGTGIAPNFGGPDGYVYDPTGRRDPFQAPARLNGGPGLKVTDPTTGAAVIDPLQRWELERLKVIGILWEVRSPRAMLKDPDGHIYTVVKNTKVGRNNGYVSAIREGEVVVVESFEVEGTTNKETKILELGK